MGFVVYFVSILYIYVIWAGDKMWPHLCPVLSPELVTGYPTLDRSPTCVGDRRTSPSHGQASTTLQSTMAPRCYTSHATTQAKPTSKDAQATLPKPSHDDETPLHHHVQTTGWSDAYFGYKHSYQWSLSDQLSQVLHVMVLEIVCVAVSLFVILRVAKLDSF